MCVVDEDVGRGANVGETRGRARVLVRYWWGVVCCVVGGWYIFVVL